MANFKLPPLSPLAGSNLSTFFGTLKYGKVEMDILLRLIITFLVVLISTPFQWIDKLYFKKIMKKKHIPEDPVFVVGHWRSGTTFLHGILAEDTLMGFVTTYQSVFPNNLKSKFVFRSFMKAHIPEKRPGDNVKLSVNFPQEDEFALSNMIPGSYYQFMYLPGQYELFYRKFIRFEIEESNRLKWKRTYREMILKALYNTSGVRPLLKNPCNTARIEPLLEIFPGAKFIHMVRNPIIVFLSSRKFFTELLPTLWLHKVEVSFIENMIIEVYEKLMKDHIRLKSLIPEKNYIEIRFEEFEKDPLKHIKSIYSKFKIGNFGEHKPAFERYIRSKSGYKKNEYQGIDGKLLEKLRDKWGFAMDYWKYDVPEELKVLPERSPKE